VEGADELWKELGQSSAIASPLESRIYTHSTFYLLPTVSPNQLSPSCSVSYYTAVDPPTKSTWLYLVCVTASLCGYCKQSRRLDDVWQNKTACY
jgi:hypothetical protein